MFFDTHAHLDYELFDPDRSNMFDRARSAGVSRIVTIGTNVISSRAAIAFAEKYDHIFAAIGHHPTDAHHFDDHLLAELQILAGHPRVVAIGETGLDYFWKDAPPAAQERLFRAMIKVANDHDLPLIIHNREAGRDILNVLISEKEKGAVNLRGIMHCFSEDEEFLKTALALNFWISISGNVTYKKSHLPQLLDKIPADRLLIETDAPFLPPVPHRGQRNEPAYIRFTAAKISEILSEPLEEIARRTYQNACDVFRLPG